MFAERKQKHVHGIPGTVIQKEYIGPRSILHLREVLKVLRCRTVFLVTGNLSYSTCGAEDCMRDLLKDYETHRFCEFSVNPKIEDISRGISVLSDLNCDTIIAVGGGSAIDVAKAINFLAAVPSSFAKFGVDSKSIGIPAPIRPLIAIPTTSGSGSEATHFCVIYKDFQKYSLAQDSIRPDIAIVDANLTMSLPEYTTAVSALDALCHAMESYWSIHSTAESKQFAASSIKLIMNSIPQGVRHPSASTRIDLAKAANLAGKAIDITKTTAPHSISYYLTARLDIPHGQAVGITLPSLLVYNADTDSDDAVDTRGADYVRRNIIELCQLLGTDNVNDAAKKITETIHQMRLETNLSALSLAKSDIETMITSSFVSDRMHNNPRKLTKKALRSILERIY